MSESENVRVDEAAYGRPYVAVRPLAEEHRPLVRELLTKLTLTDLLDLADWLPYDTAAFDAGFPRIVITRPVDVRAWLALQRRNGPASMNGGAIAELAAYVAAAAQGAVAKHLSHYLKGRRQALAEIRRLKVAVRRYDTCRTPLLGLALRGPRKAASGEAESPPGPS